MKLSIIVPIINLNKKIQDLTDKCLSSIRKYTTVPYELIIIDNGNADRWSADITIKNARNVGNGKSWNQGLKLSSGEFLLLIDNDTEILHKEWEKALIRAFDDPLVGISFPATKNRDEDDFNEKLSGFFWMMPRRTFEKVGLVDEGYGLGNFEDTDYYMRTKEAGLKLVSVPETKIKHYSRATCDQIPEVQQIYQINEQRYFNKWKVLPMLN